MPTLKQAKQLSYDPEVPPQFEGTYDRGGEQEPNYAPVYDASRKGDAPAFSSSPFQQSQKTVQPTPGRQLTGRATTGRRTVSSTPIERPTRTEQEQTTTWTPPSGEKPTFESPDYKPVIYDKRRLAAITQSKAAPFRREAMRAMQGAFTRSYGSKPERDMAIRNALNHYGTAYGKLLVQAGQAAEGQYAREREELVHERRTEYNAAMFKAQSDFTSAWQAWMKGGTQTIAKTGTTGKADESGEGFYDPNSGLRPGQTDAYGRVVSYYR